MKIFTGLLMIAFVVSSSALLPLLLDLYGRWYKTLEGEMFLRGIIYMSTAEAEHAERA